MLKQKYQIITHRQYAQYKLNYVKALITLAEQRLSSGDGVYEELKEGEGTAGEI